TNAEPGHAGTAANSDDAEQKDDQNLHEVEMLQVAKVEDNDDPDKNFQNDQELDLGHQICFARFVDQLRAFEHRSVHGKILQLAVNDNAENQPERDNDEAIEKQVVAVNGAAEERRLAQIGNQQIRFSSRFCGPGLRKRSHRIGGEQECSRANRNYKAKQASEREHGISARHV